MRYLLFTLILGLVLSPSLVFASTQSDARAAIDTAISRCNLPDLTPGQNTCIDRTLSESAPIFESCVSRGGDLTFCLEQYFTTGNPDINNDSVNQCFSGSRASSGGRRGGCVMTLFVSELEERYGGGQSSAPDGEEISEAGRSFIPLTSIPAFQDVATSGNITDFLNAIYKICIGLAALLAVFQIVRSGIVYMLGDTGFFEKREAKNDILRAVLGLLLVLSPAIVFSAIDPRILSLDIGVTDIRLSPSEGSPQASSETGETGDTDAADQENTPQAVYTPEAGKYFYAIGVPNELSPEGTSCYAVLAEDGFASAGACQERLQEVETMIRTDREVQIDRFHACSNASTGEGLTLSPNTTAELCIFSS